MHSCEALDRFPGMLKDLLYSSRWRGALLKNSFRIRTQTYTIVIMGEVPREMPKLFLQVGGEKEGIDGIVISKELSNPREKFKKLVIHLWN